jgi:hypothetical protein
MNVSGMQMGHARLLLATVARSATQLSACKGWCQRLAARVGAGDLLQGLVPATCAYPKGCALIVGGSGGTGRAQQQRSRSPPMLRSSGIS